jgi:ADP-ribosylglycohydrolase
MLGAIAGDVIGSVYEHHRIKTTQFPLFDRNCRFTDDTVMTIAVAYAVLENEDYATAMKLFGRNYPDAGYGGSFIRWLFEDEVRPYNSWGNGSAMRVSPLGFAFDDIDTCLEEAKRSAEVSHNHPEGIKGAQATALAVLLARRSRSKEHVRAEISVRFGYDLNRTLAEIREVYGFDVSCQGTVPEAIIAFLESNNFEEAIRNAISLGGDSDTLAAIAGGIAQAFYGGVPPDISKKVLPLLPTDLLHVLNRFNREHGL